MKRRELLKLAGLSAAAAALPLGVLAYKSRIPEGFVSVEKFGIKPDGRTNWEETSRWEEMLEASVTTGVYWPPGYYATGINFRRELSGSKMHFEPGSVIGGVFHLISGAVKLAQVSAVRRVDGYVYVDLKDHHSFEVGDLVQVRMNFDSSFNADHLVVAGVSNKTIVLRQNGSDEVGSPVVASSVNLSPLVGVRITGLLTTTDRFGTINCKDCYVESCWVMNDPERHSAWPGKPSRGAHIYVGTEGLTVGRLVVDYAGGANTAAAFSVDGHFWNPSNCRFGMVHIKDSAYHGAYITGFGHRFDSIVIDKFAKENGLAEILQDSNGLEQTKEIKGIWFNRCWDTHVRVLSTTQDDSDSGRSETYHAMIDETGNSIYGVRDGFVQIDDWIASGVRGKGIAIGDPRFDSVKSNLKATVVKVSEGSEGVGVEESIFSCNAVSMGSSAKIERLAITSHSGRKMNVADNAALYVDSFV